MKKNLNYLFFLVLSTAIFACGGDGDEPDPCAIAITFTVVGQQNASAGQADGSITVSASGGNGGFQYSIDGTNFQSSSTFSGLAAGSYVLTVRDSEGCTTTVQALLEENAPEPPSFATEIFPIIQENCSITACHGENRSPLLTNYDEISAQAERIKARTGAGTMPPASRDPLTTEQIALIAAWVDGGAPNN